ncbi:hypothetical protein SY89_00323 [Halolamina pelagica]|uniref:Uncharacterized protein n=1 Tax=Halolamina pelagica TaxID=699431 RepID=A0A0P7H814_9EURY|nr:hypothetical protein [Halolamina pelagica]KPN29609.1 hypothetical protein SY89_00323 [Halolamina pelagica]
MADPKHDDGARLDLGDEEQWVLHAALLQYLDERTDEATESTPDDHGFPDPPAGEDEPPAGEKSAAAIDLLDALEGEEPLRLDREALLLVRELLSEYLAGAPLRDRATCRSVLAAVRDEL